MQQRGLDLLGEYFSLERPARPQAGCSDCDSPDIRGTVFAIGSRRRTKRLCDPCMENHLAEWRAWSNAKNKRRAARR